MTTRFNHSGIHLAQTVASAFLVNSWRGSTQEDSRLDSRMADFCGSQKARRRTYGSRLASASKSRKCDVKRRGLARAHYCIFSVLLSQCTVPLLSFWRVTSSFV